LYRAAAFTFFSVKISLKTACFEEKIHHEAGDWQKRRSKGRRLLYRNFFDFFDFVAKFYRPAAPHAAGLLQPK
jgi:hypothetical protein